MKKKQRAGFTLVELMIVAVIVAILAAVAIPLMSANRQRAMVTEAEAALGTVRSAFRALYAETEDYSENLSGGTISAGAVDQLPGIADGDLDGKYFSHDDYSITEVSATAYTIQAAGATGSDVDGITVTLDENGDFTRTGL